MRLQSLKQQFAGVIPPLVTPLADEYNLDFPGLGKLIGHVLKGGVHGLFILGTTGEGPSLSLKLKYKMIEESTRIVSGRVPVLVGITDASFAESISLSKHAADCGADAVVLAPPYYFPSGQAELLEYLEHITPRLHLPLLLYNMPAMTKVDIGVETLLRASEIDGIVGFKDSSCNMIRFHEYILAMKGNPAFSLLIGPEELLAESVLFGGHGGIPGGANIFPELYVDMYNAAKEGDISAILKLQGKIFILRKLYSCGQYASSLIKGIKCALNCLDICSDFMAEPFHSFGEEQRKEIIKVLIELELKTPIV